MSHRRTDGRRAHGRGRAGDKTASGAGNETALAGETKLPTTRRRDGFRAADALVALTEPALAGLGELDGKSTTWSEATGGMAHRHPTYAGVEYAKFTPASTWSTTAASGSRIRLPPRPGRLPAHQTRLRARRARIDERGDLLMTTPAGDEVRQKKPSPIRTWTARGARSRAVRARAARLRSARRIRRLAPTRLDPSSPTDLPRRHAR